MAVMTPSYKKLDRGRHFVALGANLPAADGASPHQTCAWAVRAVAALPYVSACTVSRWFSTAPVPAGPQPRYINGVVRFAASVQPERLLADLQDLERAAGRVRGAPNAARTLDLDIVDMAGQVRDTPDPILPHPRAHLRAFVLYPLRDVAPGWVHPRLRLTIAALIAALPPQDITPL